MAITHLGYEGSIGETDWGRFGAYFGLPPGVVDAGDLAPTVAGLDVTIAPGVAFGHNIVDVVSGVESKTVSVPGSGTRYDTVVLRRDWSGSGFTPSGSACGGKTTLEIVQGGTILAVSASIQATPGVISDQPLCILSTTAGGTTTSVVADLRAWHSTASLVKSRLAMTGPLGTRYVLRDGSAEDSTQWVMTLSATGTVVPVQEWEPPAPVIPTYRIASGTKDNLAFNASGVATIVHNLGWTPQYFHAYDGRQNSVAQGLVIMEPFYEASFMNTTKAVVLGKIAATDGIYASKSLSAVRWLAVSMPT